MAAKRLVVIFYEDCGVVENEREFFFCIVFRGRVSFFPSNDVLSQRLSIVLEGYNNLKYAFQPLDLSPYYSTILLTHLLADIPHNFQLSFSFYLAVVGPYFGDGGLLMRGRQRCKMLIKGGCPHEGDCYYVLMCFLGYQLC